MENQGNQVEKFWGKPFMRSSRNGLRHGESTCFPHGHSYRDSALFRNVGIACMNVYTFFDKHFHIALLYIRF